MAQPVFLKKCTRCGAKVPSTDGHDFCLFCLGETHKVESCADCAQFTKQAKRNREYRLRLSLLESALSPTMASESLASASALQSALQSIARPTSLPSTSPMLSLQSIPAKATSLDAEPKKVKNVKKHTRPKPSEEARADTVASVVGLHRPPHEPVRSVSTPALVPVTTAPMAPAPKPTTDLPVTPAATAPAPRLKILPTAPPVTPLDARPLDLDRSPQWL